jgi:hypothetical protein
MLNVFVVHSPSPLALWLERDGCGYAEALARAKAAEGRRTTLRARGANVIRASVLESSGFSTAAFMGLH